MSFRSILLGSVIGATALTSLDSDQGLSISHAAQKGHEALQYASSYFDDVSSELQLPQLFSNESQGPTGFVERSRNYIGSFDSGYGYRSTGGIRTISSKSVSTPPPPPGCLVENVFSPLLASCT